MNSYCRLNVKCTNDEKKENVGKPSMWHCICGIHTYTEKVCSLSKQAKKCLDLDNKQMISNHMFVCAVHVNNLTANTNTCSVL